MSKKVKALQQRQVAGAMRSPDRLCALPNPIEKQTKYKDEGSHETWCEENEIRRGKQETSDEKEAEHHPYLQQL